MSEHTLDDLAARLAALGWRQHRRMETWVEFEHDMQHGDGKNRLMASLYLTATGYTTGKGEVLPLFFDDHVFEAINTIRQWQASAEPAPPPAAPVVTITGEMIYRGAVYLAEWRDIEEWDALDEDSKGGYVSESQDFLEAALRGADLAPEPEGARDDE